MSVKINNSHFWCWCTLHTTHLQQTHGCQLAVFEAHPCEERWQITNYCSSRLEWWCFKLWAVWRPFKIILWTWAHCQSIKRMVILCLFVCLFVSCKRQTISKVELWDVLKKPRKTIPKYYLTKLQENFCKIVCILLHTVSTCMFK